MLRVLGVRQLGFRVGSIRLMDKILHDLIYLNFGNGTILYLGHAEFCPSTVGLTTLSMQYFSCGLGRQGCGETYEQR